MYLLLAAHQFAVSAELVQEVAPVITRLAFRNGKLQLRVQLLLDFCRVFHDSRFQVLLQLLRPRAPYRLADALERIPLDIDPHELREQPDLIGDIRKIVVADVKRFQVFSGDDRFLDAAQLIVRENEGRKVRHFGELVEKRDLVVIQLQLVQLHQLRQVHDLAQVIEVELQGN